jgi:hypothetical protein
MTVLWRVGERCERARAICSPYRADLYGDSLLGAKDHRLNRASMEPSRPSIGGKEVGTMGVEPAQHRDTTVTLIAFRHGAGGGTVRPPIG